MNAEKGSVGLKVDALKDMCLETTLVADGKPEGAIVIGDDPVHKLLLDRDPLEGEALASQPTLSRFENAPGSKSLLRMGLALAEAVIRRHRKRLRGRARRITVELDPTDDPTHGGAADVHQRSLRHVVLPADGRLHPVR